MAWMDESAEPVDVAQIQGLAELASKFNAKQQERLSQDRITKMLKKEEDELESQLIMTMEASGFTSIKADDGFSYGVVCKNYPKIFDKPAFLEWAKENMPDELTISTASKALKDEINRMTDESEEFPPGLTTSVTKYISIRKA